MAHSHTNRWKNVTLLHHQPLITRFIHHRHCGVGGRRPSARKTRARCGKINIKREALSARTRLDVRLDATFPFSSGCGESLPADENKRRKYRQTLHGISAIDGSEKKTTQKERTDGTKRNEKNVLKQQFGCVANQHAIAMFIQHTKALLEFCEKKNVVQSFETKPWWLRKGVSE